MNRKFLICAGLMLMSLSLLTGCNNDEMLTGCNSDESLDEGKVAVLLSEVKNIPLTAEQKNMVVQNNDFSYELFRKVYELQESPKSMIISPISVSMMLGMLNDGAEGKTSEEILSMLGFNTSDKQEVNEYYHTLMEEIPNVDPKVLVKIANYMAINNQKKDLQLSETFRSDMQRYYQAEVASLDFTSPVALTTINNWCSKQTDDNIPSIIEELNPDAFMYLLNAVSFNASWLNKFDANDTKEMAFTMDGGSEVNRLFMHREAQILYGENETFSSIVLPYGSNGESWKMRIYLPQQGKTVNDVLDFLCDASAEEYSTSTQFVDILVPRFTSDSQTDLGPAIKSMGGTTMFDPRLSELTICSNGRAWVNKLQQKTSIDVSEDGTELQTVTICEIEAVGCPLIDLFEFHANRPFVYVVEEARSGVVFFTGVYQGN